MPLPATRSSNPHTTDAEQSLLGAMLLTTDAVIVETHRFYSPAHQTKSAATIPLYSSSRPVDVINVNGELKRQGVNDTIGGTGALM